MTTTTTRPPHPVTHALSALFAQLGLPDDAVGIAQFVRVHAALSDGFRLPDAPYWNVSQAAFLRESWIDDADWSGVVDQLSQALISPAYPEGAPRHRTRQL